MSAILWNKATKSGQSWTQEELSNALHWPRQFFSLLAGFLFGLVPIKGVTGNALFIVASVTLSFLYLRFLQPDSEDGDHWHVIMEGAVPSYALFLVSWITLYSISQY